MVYDGSTYIYATRGDNNIDFWRYDIANNTWADMTDAAQNINTGGSLLLIGNTIYSMAGNGKTFMAYSISGNSWDDASYLDVTDNVKVGGDMVYDGSTYIYATRGDNNKDFWRYDIANNTWADMTDAAQNINTGGSLLLVEGATIGGVTSTSFTQNPVMCDDFTIKANEDITVKIYVDVTTGNMPASPDLTAKLKDGATTIITLTSPTYNSGTGLVAWTGQLGSDYTSLTTGSAIILEITTAEVGVGFTIEYDSATDPSFIELPTDTYINVESLEFYDAAYSGGSLMTSGNVGDDIYVRVTVSDPFGYADISSLDLTITPNGTPITGIPVVSSGSACDDKVFEYLWEPTTTDDYDIDALAHEGSEGIVSDLSSTSFTVCNMSVTGTDTAQPRCDDVAPNYSGEITLTPTNGTSSYLYNWDDGTTTGNGSGLVIYNLPAGDYDITLTDDNGCTASTSVTLNEPQAPTVLYTVTDVSCMDGTNGTILLTPIGGNQPYTYAWSHGLSATQYQSGLGADTYSVVVTGEDGCASASTDIEVTEPAGLLISADETDPTCTVNGAIDITVTGGIAPYIYNWDDLPGNSNSADRTALLPGTYYLKVSDGNDCTATYSKTLSSQADPEETTGIPVMGVPLGVIVRSRLLISA